MPRRSKRSAARRGELFPVLRKPAMQLALAAVVAFVIYLIAAAGGQGTRGGEVGVDEGYRMAVEGAFVLDVRTAEEWDAFHAPGTAWIPLEELPTRLGELPADRRILVVCRTGNRSREGRDILFEAGFDAVSMAGGLTEWAARGYPIEGSPPP
jgi:rhodanese-related sulfurtransferase